MSEAVDEQLHTKDRAETTRWFAREHGRATAGVRIRRIDAWRGGDDRFLISTADIDGSVRCRPRPGRIAVTVCSAVGVPPDEQAGPLILPTGAAMEFRDLTLRAFTVDSGRMVRIARMLYDDPNLELTFTGVAPVSSEAGAFWRTAFDLAGMRADAGGLRDPRVRDGVYRALAMATLEVFPIAGDRPRRQAAALRRLRAYRDGARFLREFAALPVSLSDAARAARTTSADLVAAFLTHDRAGRTPSAYLEAERLGAAHDDLITDRRPDPRRVDEIAHRWGFGSTTYFLRRYRREFGADPRDDSWQSRVGSAERGPDPDRGVA